MQAAFWHIGHIEPYQQPRLSLLQDQSAFPLAITSIFNDSQKTFISYCIFILTYISRSFHCDSGPGSFSNHLVLSLQILIKPPYPIKWPPFLSPWLPRIASTGPIHFKSVIFFIIFLIFLSESLYYLEMFLSSFSTISFHSSSVWLPEYVSPTIFPSLSTKNVSGKAEIPFKRPFIIVESGTRNG